MRLLSVIVPALLAVAMLADAASAVAAQGTPEASEGAGYPDGLEKMFFRTYSADLTAMLDPAATPGAMPSGWFLIGATVLEFESEDAAAAGMDEILAQMDTELAAVGSPLVEIELDVDVEHAARLTEATDEEGLTSRAIQAIARDGVYGYAVIGVNMGEGSDPVPLVEYLLEEMQSTEVSDDPETYNPDGTSEGGLWAKLPSAENVRAQAAELTVVGDQISYPIAEGTPAT
jgi:hypothetical protein